MNFLRSVLECQSRNCLIFIENSCEKMDILSSSLLSVISRTAKPCEPKRFTPMQHDDKAPCLVDGGQSISMSQMPKHVNPLTSDTTLPSLLRETACHKMFPEMPGLVGIRINQTLANPSIWKIPHCVGGSTSPTTSSPNLKQRKHAHPSPAIEQHEATHFFWGEEIASKSWAWTNQFSTSQRIDVK